MTGMKLIISQIKLFQVDHYLIQTWLFNGVIMNGIGVALILIILMLVMNNLLLQRLLEIIGKKESDIFGTEKLQPEQMLQVKPLLIELLLQKQSEKLLMIEL